MNKGGYFWYISVSLLFAASVILVFFPGIDATLFANEHHTAWADTFFKWYTQVAEWPVVVLAILIAFKRNIATGIWAGVCYAAEAIIVNFSKSTINAPRPRIEIGSDALHQIQGVEIHSWQSFPSGHTAAAFVGFGLIGILSPNKYIQISCAIAAALVGYSRLYLGQHYLRDAAAAEAIALLVLLIFNFTLPKFELLLKRRNLEQ